MSQGVVATFVIVNLTVFTVQYIKNVDFVFFRLVRQAETASIVLRRQRRGDITNVSKNKQQAPIMWYSLSLEKGPYVRLWAMLLSVATDFISLNKSLLAQPCQTTVVKQLTSY